MKCENCKEDLTRIGKVHYFCGKCNEIFELKDKKLILVKERKEIIEQLSKRATDYKDNLFDIADKLGVDIGADEEGSDSPFFFG